METNRILLQHTKNTRSLSHLQNRFGKHIKEHLLIRSDALNELDEEDFEILYRDFHLKRVIDLRCDNEVEDKPDRLSSDVELILNPILPSKTVGMTKTGDAKRDLIEFIEKLQATGLEHSTAFMMRIYQDVVTSPFSQSAYTRFLNVFLHPVSGATLWHCSAGKDRAGFATILLLSALDFSKEVIAQDYLATNDYYKPTVLEMKQLLGDSYEPILWSVFGVEPAFLDTIFQTIDSYGGMDAYLTKLGIGSKEKKKLQEIYLEE